MHQHCSIKGFRASGLVWIVYFTYLQISVSAIRLQFQLIQHVQQFISSRCLLAGPCFRVTLGLVGYNVLLLLNWNEPTESAYNR